MEVQFPSGSFAFLAIRLPFLGDLFTIRCRLAHRPLLGAHRHG